MSTRFQVHGDADEFRMHGDWDQFPIQGDAEHVLFSVRLGWGIAELRGRNRPGGPPGDSPSMPPNTEDALPLRVERSSTELRIEAQTVVEYLARRLRVNEAADGTRFGRALDAKARLLYHVRAPKAARALQSALRSLQPPGGHAPSVDAALVALQGGQAAQQVVVSLRQQAVSTALASLSAAQARVTELAGRPAGDRAAADAARTVAEAAAVLQLEKASAAGEAAGLEALTSAITELEQAVAASAQTAPAAGAAAVTSRQAQLELAALQPWSDLATLIWEFDAHIQDGLAAQSETRAMAYQLGRGLSETYWALDPGQREGATGWNFLLGTHRCAELTRLVGRLGSYMNEYTAPAIASSLQVWLAVAAEDSWRGKDGEAAVNLYAQIRRWFELIILGQNPTTLIRPAELFKSWRTAGRAIKFFWPQVVVLAIGLAALVFLIVYFVRGGSTLEKTLSGLLAGAGLVLAGLSGALKSAGQALFKRLRQDAYTDLIALAVQTAPKPHRKRQLRKALAERNLTPATPN